jgi:hypothetical protein
MMQGYVSFVLAECPSPLDWHGAGLLRRVHTLVLQKVITARKCFAAPTYEG